MTLKAVTRYCG